MRNIFFTVGPTQIHPKLGTFLNDGLKKGVYSISHRGREFGRIFAHTVSSLKKLLNVPRDSHVFFIGSATEAMELIIENCVENKSFHFVNGAFSKRFFLTAKELLKHPEACTVPAGEGFDFAGVKIPKSAELVCFTQNETSTGVMVEMKDVRTLKKRNPNKLFAVDIVSSTPYAPVDWSVVDCAFFSVQKGFGMPSGLGVLIVNNRCIKRAEELHGNRVNIGSFHNFPTLLKYARKNQTPETPNAMAIYILGRICDSYNKYGIEKIRKETESRATAMYDFFDKHSAYKPFVKNKKWRSKTVVVFNTPNGSASVIKKLEKHGHIVGAGYGEFEAHHIRVGNFPMHKMGDVKKVLKILG